jgi:polyphosphate glucokinase
MNKSKDSDEVLGIDIGGTGIKASPVNIKKGKLIRTPVKVSTPQPAEPKSILPLLRDLIKNYNWSGPIGCGFPGVIKKGVVLTAANLTDDWISVDLKSEIEGMTNCPASIINDADGAALAEMQFGAGRNFNKKDAGVVMLFTLGTGIGSALFVDGKLVPNTEFGHMEMDGKDAEDWAATVIREKEKLSWKIWGERVNKFLKRIEVLFTPDLIIIGGGVSENPEKFFPYLTVKAKLVSAQMANDAGIIGAALSTLISI